MGKVADGIPDAEEADGNDGEENQYDVQRMDADRIGIDHEVALAGTQTNDAELLLQPT